MMILRKFPLTLVFALAGWGSAWAQPGEQRAFTRSTRPMADVGGHAGRELNQLYTRSIGQGYSSSSINSLTLQQSRARIPYVGQSRATTGIRGNAGPQNLGLSRRSTNKPFSSVTPTPTVSPYLNLFRDSFEDDVLPNYNTLVEPQLQQRRVNEQLQRQTLELNRRVQAISAQSAYSIRGSEQLYPTGHSVGFNYYSHFYPSMGTSGRR